MDGFPKTFDTSIFLLKIDGFLTKIDGLLKNIDVFSRKSLDFLIDAGKAAQQSQAWIQGGQARLGHARTGQARLVQ